MMFATANSDPGALGSWVIIAFLVINGLAALGGLVAFFATRREVQEIDRRVRLAEESLVVIRSEMKADKEDLILSGDKRSSVLHNRINPLVENTAAMKGGMEAFVTSFDNFTQMMKNLIDERRRH